MAKKIKYTLYDAFETKTQAKSVAKGLREGGQRINVRKITPQAGGRLKWGVFEGGFRKNRYLR